MKLKNTSDRDMKYIFVDYYIVNPVGDVISGVDEGVKSENEEYTKPREFQYTGPIKAGKSYSPWVSGVVTGSGYKAFPWRLRLMYMGEKSFVDIVITKDNIKTYFPKIEWMEVNRYNPAL